MQLYNSIVLWYCKESVRKTVQRKVQPPEGSEKVKFEAIVKTSAVNMVLLCFVVQVVLSAAVYFGVTILYNQPHFDYFKVSILITVLAALVESACEPFYVLMLLNMDFSVRAKAESIAIFFKSVLIYLLVFKGFGLLAYAVAQLVYGFILLALYFYQMKERDLAQTVRTYFSLNEIPGPSDRTGMSKYLLD